MKTLLQRRIFLFCLLIIPAAGLTVTACDRGQKQGPPSARPAPVVSFLAVKPEKTVLFTTLPGRTSAFRVAQIRPQVSGLIQTRLFEEGSDVKGGQVLYQIDPAPFQAVVDAARARLNSAKNAAGRITSAIDMSEAGIERQKAALELAQVNAERYDQLAKSKMVTDIQHDQAATELKMAQAALKTAEAQLASDNQALEAARADIQQAQAALKTALINLKNCKVKAPISGRIGKSNVTEGAMVTAYQGIALATIQQLDLLYVDVPQSSMELLRLKRSLSAGNIHTDKNNQNAVDLILEDGSAYHHQGTLKFSDVTVDPTTGSVTLRIVFPNPEGLLLPGMFVRTIIKEGVSEEAILVPQQGVLRDQKGNPFALVVNSENTTEFRPLVLDRAMGNRWLVSSGLGSGDRLIVEGLQMLRPGTKVNAKPFSPPQAGKKPPQAGPPDKNSKQEGGA